MADSIKEKAFNSYISFSINLLRPQRRKSPLPYYPDSAHPSIEDQPTIKNYFLFCFGSTMSTASNSFTFQVSGDESKYVHPTNFSYFQFPEGHQMS